MKAEVHKNSFIPGLDSGVLSLNTVPYAVAATLRCPRIQRTVAHSPTKPAVTSPILIGQSAALALEATKLTNIGLPT